MLELSRPLLKHREKARELVEKLGDTPTSSDKFIELAKELYAQVQYIQKYKDEIEQK